MSLLFVYCMEDAEFLFHMKIIKNMLKHRHVRIILLHPPYTETQQRIIDSICRNSKNIIGQVERKPPMKEAAKEIKRLILSHHEPLINSDQLKLVLIGQQKIK